MPHRAKNRHKQRHHTHAIKPQNFPRLPAKVVSGIPSVPDAESSEGQEAVFHSELMVSEVPTE